MWCWAAFNLEKVVSGVLAKMGLIRAEQLAGLMPSTWFQRKESLSTSVLSCLENRSFQEVDLVMHGLLQEEKSRQMRSLS